MTPSSYSGTSGLSALLLRQANGVDAEVGCVRIADTWAGLFEVKSTADSPRILTAPSSIDFGALLQGEKMQKVINVRAKNLKGNITVAVPEGGNLSVSATEIPMEQALREEGFELTVTLDVKNPSLSGEQIVLSSEGAEDCVVKVTSDALPVSSLSTLKAFYGTDVKPGTIYRLATSPVLFHKQQISVADEVEGGTMFMDAYYLQDGTAGVVLMDPYIVLSSEGYAKGDAFNGLVGEVKSGKDYGFDFNVLVPVSRVKGSKLVNYSHVGSVTKNNPVTAVDVTLDQLNANRAEYVNRLIRVSGVNFENIEEDAVYTATTPLTLTDGKNKVDVLAFRGTTDDNGTSSDILGEPVPHGIINLTGISTYLSKTLIQPRGIADVEEVETQTISITVNGESTDLTVRRQEGDLPVVMKELTLDDAAQSLSVTSPFVAPGVKYVRNFANTEWQALYVPFAVDCEAWAADCDLAEIYNMHQYDDDEDGTIDRTELEVIKKVSGQLLPNVPYLIRAKEAGEKTLQLEDVTVVPTEQASVDCSSTKVAYAFNGIYTAITGSDMMNGGFYALSDGEIKQAASAEAGLHAFRWYMTATDRNGAPAPEQSIRIRLRGEDNQHTGIGSAAAGVTGVTVSAGTITVSAAPATVWNVCAADGRTVARIVTDANGNGTASRLATGVYIVGGKKVIVK